MIAKLNGEAVACHALPVIGLLLGPPLTIRIDMVASRLPAAIACGFAVALLFIIMTEARITPPNRNRRLLWIGILGAMLVAGLFLVFQALNENTQFFENPSDVVADGFESRSDVFKIGGLVRDGTVDTQGLTTRFIIDDFERDMARELHVTYTGVLPDLFREGQGVVVSGRLTTDSHFQAVEVLAKHDENYQPVIEYRDGEDAPKS